MRLYKIAGALLWFALIKMTFTNIYISQAIQWNTDTALNKNPSVQIIFCNILSPTLDYVLIIEQVIFPSKHNSTKCHTVFEIRPSFSPYCF